MSRPDEIFSPPFFSVALSERIWLLCAMPHVVLMMVLVLSPRAFVCIRSRFSSFFSVYVCVTANVDCHYAHRCILTIILSALCLFDHWFGLFGHPAYQHSNSNIILNSPKALQVIELEVTFGEFWSHFFEKLCYWNLRMTNPCSPKFW